MSRLQTVVRAALAGASLLAAGCLDVATSAASRRVNLSIVPTFASSGPAEAFASDVDSFEITVAGSLHDTTYYVSLAPGQDSILVTVSVTVNAGADTIGVTFEGFSSSTGLKLYSGNQSFVLQAGLPSEPQPVQVAYVGPGGRVGSILLASHASALQPSATSQMTFTALDTTGAAMPLDSVPVRFLSRNLAVATVDPNGLIRAVADGVVFVVVRSLARSSVQDSTRITVAAAPPPLIDLAPGSITFNDTVGTSNPPGQVVNVTNGGGQTLSGLSLGTTTYGAGATGWLTASIGTAIAPTSVTLTVNNASLAAGTYTATVPVLSGVASNSPQNITVTINIAAPSLATIAIAPGFVAARPGDVVPVTVTGRNAAGAVVPVANVTYLSRSAGVATVHPTNGTITAVAGGTSVIVGTVGGTSIADSVLVAVAANGTALVSAVGDTRFFDVPAPGDTVRVRVSVDLRGVSPEKLGSYNAELTWNTARLTFVRAAEVAGGWSGATINCPSGITAGGCSPASNAPSGTLRFGGADAAGRAGPTVALLDVTFVAGTAGVSNLLLTLSDLSASQTFANLLTNALIRTGVVRIQ